jgi:hypothetical protein
MAKTAKILGELAYDLCAHESLEQGERVEPGLARLQQEQIIAIKFELVLLDSKTFKVHPDGIRALNNGTASYRSFREVSHKKDFPLHPKDIKAQIVPPRHQNRV